VPDPKKPGRPPDGPVKSTEPVATVVPPATYDRLCREANARGVSLSKLVRTILTAAAAGPPAPPKEEK
jgi:hypothetical protein